MRKRAFHDEDLIQIESGISCKVQKPCIALSANRLNLLRELGSNQNWCRLARESGMQFSEFDESLLQFCWVTVLYHFADKPVRVPIDFNVRNDGFVSAMPMRFDLDILRSDNRNLSQCLSKCFYSFILQVPFH